MYILSHYCKIGHICCCHQLDHVC